MYPRIGEKIGLLAATPPTAHAATVDRAADYGVYDRAAQYMRRHHRLLSCNGSVHLMS